MGMPYLKDAMFWSWNDIAEWANTCWPVGILRVSYLIFQSVVRILKKNNFFDFSKLSLDTPYCDKG